MTNAVGRSKIAKRKIEQVLAVGAGLRMVAIAILVAGFVIIGILVVDKLFFSVEIQ